jgi:hypothetical protein
MLSNLEVFLSPNEFSAEACFGAFSFQCLFDIDYAPMGDWAEGRNITALAKTSDTLSLHHGDRLTIQSLQYEIVGIHPDGDGAFTELVLKEV